MNKLILGDPHLTHKSLDRGEQLFDLVEQLGHDTIWLGDFLDTKEVIRGKCLNALIAYLQRSNLQHIIIIGNHDWFNLDCDAHALEALKLLPNVTIVDRPMIIDELVYFPYEHNKEKLLAWIEEYQHPERVLFAHLEVTDFDYGNGRVCTTGLPISALTGFKRVVSGHFHKFQELNNLTYLGTPFSHSFGESDQLKYIGFYDVKNDVLKKTESPFPRHLTIEFNCDTINDDCEHQMIQIDESNFYRIILIGTQVNIDRFPKYMYEGGANDKLNIKWISRPSDYVENNITIEDTASNEAQFTKWASNVRKLDEETIKLGLQILETCR